MIIASAPVSRVAALASRGLAGAWNRGALPRPTLEPDDLVLAAVKAERSEAFDGEEWRPALSTLTAALNSEARLSPLGRALAHGQLVKALRERLRAVALLARHPEIARIPIRAPLVVLGPMRSGTTRVQRLLACDKRFAHTRGFETMSPVPGVGGQARRIASVTLGLALLRRLNPLLTSIHPTTATAPEEEFGFFNPSFVSSQYAIQWHVPGYAAWAARVDRTESYRWFRRFLQITAWARRDRAPRPWVLKAPEFMDDLGALLDAFPDARLLCLHRDPAQVVPSAASLAWQHRRLHSDHADPHETGRAVLTLTRRRIERAAAVRARRADVPQLDLDYACFEHDWRAPMRKVYDWLDMPFNETVQRRMGAYVAGAHEHRGHSYTAAQFGLSGAAVPLPQVA